MTTLGIHVDMYMPWEQYCTHVPWKQDQTHALETGLTVLHMCPWNRTHRLHTVGQQQGHGDVVHSMLGCKSQGILEPQENGVAGQQEAADQGPLI